MLNEWRVSGLSRVVVKPVAEVSSMPLRTSVGMGVLGQVLLIGGAAWPTAAMDLPVILGSAELREKSVRVNGDLFWEVEIRFGYNDKDELSSGDVNKRFICYVEDRDGVGRLIGTQEDPLTVDTDYGTGNRPGTGNKSLFVLRGRLRLRPPYYQP